MVLPSAQSQPMEGPMNGQPIRNEVSIWAAHGYTWLDWSAIFRGVGQLIFFTAACLINREIFVIQRNDNR